MNEVLNNMKMRAQHLTVHYSREIERDNSANKALYDKIQVLALSTANRIHSHLPVGETLQGVEGVMSKLRVIIDLYIDVCLKEVVVNLRRYCREQADMMENVMNEIRSSLWCYIFALNSVHNVIQVLNIEKNNFASKVQGLAQIIGTICRVADSSRIETLDKESLGIVMSMNRVVDSEDDALEVKKDQLTSPDALFRIETKPEDIKEKAREEVKEVYEKLEHRTNERMTATITAIDGSDGLSQEQKDYRKKVLRGEAVDDVSVLGSPQSPAPPSNPMLVAPVQTISAFLERHFVPGVGMVEKVNIRKLEGHIKTLQIDLLRAKEFNMTDAERAQFEGERVKQQLELAAKERIIARRNICARRVQKAYRLHVLFAKFQRRLHLKMARRIVNLIYRFVFWKLFRFNLKKVKKQHGAAARITRLFRVILNRKLHLRRCARRIVKNVRRYVKIMRVYRVAKMVRETVIAQTLKMEEKRVYGLDYRLRKIETALETLYPGCTQGMTHLKGTALDGTAVEGERFDSVNSLNYLRSASNKLRSRMEVAETDTDNLQVAKNSMTRVMRLTARAGAAWTQNPSSQVPTIREEDNESASRKKSGPRVSFTGNDKVKPSSSEGLRKNAKSSGKSADAAKTLKPTADGGSKLKEDEKVQRPKSPKKPKSGGRELKPVDINHSSLLLQKTDIDELCTDNRFESMSSREAVRSPDIKLKDRLPSPSNKIRFIDEFESSAYSHDVSAGIKFKPLLQRLKQIDRKVTSFTEAMDEHEKKGFHKVAVTRQLLDNLADEPYAMVFGNTNASKKASFLAGLKHKIEKPNNQVNESLELVDHEASEVKESHNSFVDTENSVDVPESLELIKRIMSIIDPNSYESPSFGFRSRRLFSEVQDSPPSVEWVESVCIQFLEKMVNVMQQKGLIPSLSFEDIISGTSNENIIPLLSPTTSYDSWKLALDSQRGRRLSTVIPVWAGLGVRSLASVCLERWRRMVGLIRCLHSPCSMVVPMADIDYVCLQMCLNYDADPPGFDQAQRSHIAGDVLLRALNKCSLSGNSLSHEDLGKKPQDYHGNNNFFVKRSTIGARFDDVLLLGGLNQDKLHVLGLLFQELTSVAEQSPLEYMCMFVEGVDVHSQKGSAVVQFVRSLLLSTPSINSEQSATLRSQSIDNDVHIEVPSHLWGTTSLTAMFLLKLTDIVIRTPLYLQNKRYFTGNLDTRVTIKPDTLISIDTAVHIVQYVCGNISYSHWKSTADILKHWELYTSSVQFVIMQLFRKAFDVDVMQVREIEALRRLKKKKEQQWNRVDTAELEMNDDLEDLSDTSITATSTITAPQAPLTEPPSKALSNRTRADLQKRKWNLQKQIHGDYGGEMRFDDAVYSEQHSVGQFQVRPRRNHSISVGELEIDLLVSRTSSMPPVAVSQNPDETGEKELAVDIASTEPQVGENALAEEHSALLGKLNYSLPLISVFQVIQMLLPYHMEQSRLCRLGFWFNHIARRASSWSDDQSSSTIPTNFRKDQEILSRDVFPRFLHDFTCSSEFDSFVFAVFDVPMYEENDFLGKILVESVKIRQQGIQAMRDTKLVTFLRDSIRKLSHEMLIDCYDQVLLQHAAVKLTSYKVFIDLICTCVMRAIETL